MILFCDTSALVKLYVVEVGSDRVRELVSKADIVAVSRIAWAEYHAALARRAREMPADAPAIESAKQALAADWPHFLVMEVSQSVVESAGDLADTFALRGYDSVQLGSAYQLLKDAGQPVAFACYDRRLNKAAATVGMTVPFLNG